MAREAGSSETTDPAPTPPALDPPPSPALAMMDEPQSLSPSPQQPLRQNRTKPLTRDDLGDGQELTITGRLLDPISITFSQTAERVRAFSNRPPARLYRTFYEDSKTLSAYMNTENQPKHREAEGIKILPRNAFQAIGAPDLCIDLALNRLERHLSWQTVKGPSSWISAFHNLHYARRRAVFHTEESTKIGHRISIAGIVTKGLVPATVHAEYETTYNIITSYGKGRRKEITDTYLEMHRVAIPAWIRQCAVPADGSSISPHQLKASGADLWVSITELRHSNLRNVSRNAGFYEAILKNGHDYEWLCLGSIKKVHITCVMPWDGKALFSREEGSIVYSKSSPEKYVFNWQSWQWHLNPKLFALAVFRDRKAALARKGAREQRKALRFEKNNKCKSGAKRLARIPAPKRKRGPILDQDGNDISLKPSKIVRTNADVWDLMITVQRSLCHCKELRRTRAGSAQL